MQVSDGVQQTSPTLLHRTAKTAKKASVPPPPTLGSKRASVTSSCTNSDVDSAYHGCSSSTSPTSSTAGGAAAMRTDLASTPLSAKKPMMAVKGVTTAVNRAADTATLKRAGSHTKLAVCELVSRSLKAGRRVFMK